MTRDLDRPDGHTWKAIALTSIVGNICFAVAFIFARIIEATR